ncbi:MAG: hypothetical protein HDR23_02705 [Lachnospiraceae bacterium]|nr:hypothetical protein [Lachnospiraceae bacterium]MBD5455380.1 hypothetical protein [Lachnospiraceae bacterium]
MVEIIKDVGIFIVIAQALLYFVPGPAYSKYVKVIIGIVMIAKMAQPVLAIMVGEEWEEILSRSMDPVQVQGVGTEEFKDRSSERIILSEIEKELKDRLNENPIEGYIVESVSVKEDSAKGVEGITIAVLKTEERGENEIKIEKITIDETTPDISAVTEAEQDRLKEYYGNLLAMPAVQIEIAGL